MENLKIPSFFNFEKMQLCGQDISCWRGALPLFNNVGFSLAAGEMLHIEGENGAGKSTLMRILLGLATPDSGVVLWNNVPIAQSPDFKENLCFIGHSNAIKEELTPLENLQISTEIAGIALHLDVAVQSLCALNLKKRLDVPTKFLSQGQKRRVALSRLAFDTRCLWVLDEPFVALDSQALEWLVAKINAHSANGGLLVFTSHQKIDGLKPASAPMKHLRLKSPH